MKVFDINISPGFTIRNYFIRPVIHNNVKVYEVWGGDIHRFSLERNKRPGVGLVLTNEYLNKEIDKDLVQEISTGIQLHYLL